MQPPKALVFTTYATGLRNVLRTDAGVTATSASPSLENVTLDFKAIWDTGATATVVTPAVAVQCGLVQTGLQRVGTANGTAIKPTYIVDLYLPNMLCVPGVRVTEGDLPTGTDLLIGMDIIGSGDFAVTNFDDKTVFTFRMPSMGLIDFRVDPKYATPGATNPPNSRLPGRLISGSLPPASVPRTSRNATCPCGSGRKYKRCHGKNPTT